MQSSKRKWIITAGVFLVLILASIFIFSSSKKDLVPPPNLIDSTSVVKEVIGPKIKSIGASVQGRKIEAYTYGTGATHIAFVGGVHGGYE